MRKIVLTSLVVLVSLFVFDFAKSEEQNSNETELNFFTGMFDFSDTKQASGLLGIQHKNEELFRDSFLGNIK